MNLTFLCWIVAYRAWGYAGLRMQYAVRRRKGFRHMSLWLSRLCTYQRFCCFTPYASWQGIGFMVYGLLILVPWITEDHGSV